MATLSHELSMIESAQILVEALREERIALNGYNEGSVSERDCSFAMENTEIALERYIHAGGTYADARNLGAMC